MLCNKHVYNSICCIRERERESERKGERERERERERVRERERERELDMKSHTCHKQLLLTVEVSPLNHGNLRILTMVLTFRS